MRFLCSEGRKVLSRESTRVDGNLLEFGPDSGILDMFARGERWSAMRGLLALRFLRLAHLGLPTTGA